MKTFDRKSFTLHALYAAITAVAMYLLANIGQLQDVLSQYVSPEVAWFIIAIVASFLKKLGDNKELS